MSAEAFTSSIDTANSIESRSDSPLSAHSVNSTPPSTTCPTPLQKPIDSYGTLLDTNGNQFIVPDFTIKDIRDAIPAHCFERSAARGLAYVARDLTLLGVTFYIFNAFVTPTNVPSFAARTILWSLYTVLQGFFATGVWVLAHECGHQAFSPSKTLNDTVGWILHSALLVPYFSWKISHGKHHKATGNVERDMVFVPKSREKYASRIGRFAHELDELTEDAPLRTALYLVGRQLIGWPMYLFTNETGHNFHERQPEGRGSGKKNGLGGGVNHFSQQSPLYEEKDAKLILLSDLGLGITCSVLYYLGQTFGWANMAVWYFIPYLWVNNWLVAITYLQHTDPSLPHYRPAAWSFVRGAAATIDREFGFIGRSLLHGIIETHVLHHYVSTIPFYHADEATAAIKPVMGAHYRADVKDGAFGFLRSMWVSLRTCQWVEESEGAQGQGRDVLFFRNRNGIGPTPLKMSDKSS